LLLVWKVATRAADRIVPWLFFIDTVHQLVIVSLRDDRGEHLLATITAGGLAKVDSRLNPDTFFGGLEVRCKRVNLMSVRPPLGCWGCV
jgi:hypothetical protein